MSFRQTFVQIAVAITTLSMFSAAPIEAQIPVQDFRYAVTDKGWRNLRYIEFPALRDMHEIWYACGRQKIIINFHKRPFDLENYEIIGGKVPAANQFEALSSEVIELENFINARRAINRTDFINRLTASGSKTPVPKMPIAFGTGSSEASLKAFYYILPREFNVQGAQRTFWLNTHYTAKIRYRLKPESPIYKGFEISGEQGRDEVNDGWLGRRSPSGIMRMTVSCATNVLRVWSETTYNSDGTVDTSTEGDASVRIMPDTVADGWRSMACLIS